MSEILRKQGIQDKPIVPGDPNPTMVPTADIKIGRIRRMTAPLIVPLAAAPQDTLALSPREVVSWVVDNWQALGTGATIIGTGVGIATYVHRRRTRSEDMSLAQTKTQDERFDSIIADLENSGTEKKATVAIRLLPLLNTAGYERFHQSIFQIAVNHFRNRTVNRENPRLNVADQEFLPVFLKAASRVRENLEKDGKMITPDVAKKFLNASSVHLDGARMQNVKLSSLYMPNATFTKTVLEGADLSKANLEKTNLENANLEKANLSSAVLFDANFSNAELSNINLSQARLSDANFSKANLSRANLFDAVAPFANFSHATLPRANLSEASLPGADFSNALLSRINLSEAYLEEANFSKVDLSDATLTHANLDTANFTDANLSWANLTGAYIFGTNLWNTAKYLRKANIYAVNGLTKEQRQQLLAKGAVAEPPHRN